MGNTIGTPDWQRGTVSSQSLLATVPSGVIGVDFVIPANVEVLWVVVDGVSTPPLVISARTVDTFVELPSFNVPNGASATSTFFAVLVSSVIDSNVRISFSTGPGGTWQVIAESSGRFTLDVAAASTVITPGASSASSNAVLVAGSDGVDAHYLSTNASGQLQVEIANMIIPSPTVTGPDAYGDPAVVGISADYARGDHDHGLPAASGGGPLSVTQYGPTTDPAYAISATAMTAVDTTHLTTSSFTVPASGRIKVTVSGVVSTTLSSGQVFLAMLNHSGGAQLGPTSCVALLFSNSTYDIPFTKTFIITGLSAGSLQLDLAMHSGPAAALHAIESATPADTNLGPVTIIVEAA